ncbi:exodeoxyribonuclease V subunit beta [Thaumasiovibrio subtropicus]|uniref:exodeoxyribonuclease V subunit beta n=1 Tax=Thaumasiovibrio subtropicus TaxID=1891207 RepID=UPI000B363347|nr:exodeoxyribonuclease V subunit beta [Thaumasiovibrio subtropicus]
MTDKPIQLDPLTLPLAGMRLIEASAGTGKTYTITGLYLRLLLGHGGRNAYPQPLSVDQILVVTFTEAATAELRDRIRRRIHEARVAFTLGQSDDDLLQALLAATDDHALAARQLLAAERQMDEAAIYTIHGFCQRMLSQNAFESGTLFEHEFITDESRIRFQAVADYWRRRFYPLDATLANLVRQEWKSPYDLHPQIDKYLSGSEVALMSEVETLDIAALHQENLQRIDSVKAQWRAVEGELHALISESGVNKRSYTKTSLPKALQEVTAWAAQSTLDYQLPKSLEKFSQQVLVEKTPSGEPPLHAVFEAIEALLAEPPSLRARLMADAITHCRQGLQDLKAQQSWLSFDDLLTQLSDALRHDSEKILTERIRALYPVAMIDEFQDTDPLQYHIFASVYAQSDLPALSEQPVEATISASPQLDLFAEPPQAMVANPSSESRVNTASGLLMIGDPKQAIYAFRGADIFTYIQARRQVQARYTLGVNWRSTADMVKAANAIFAHAQRPFIYDDDIPFLPVNPSPKAAEKGWWVEGERMPAMQIWDLPAEVKTTKKGDESVPVSADHYRQQMALASAREIARLLTRSQQGAVTLGKEETGNALQAGDIAVLVRTGFEARTVQQALSRYGIDSVYLSNRDSVYAQPIAIEILRLLHAAMEPEDELVLRAALATPLLAATAQELDELNHSELLWETAVSEFRDYGQLWRRRGVMPMLRQVLFRRELTDRLLAEDGGERVLTDYLHLGEMLQAERQKLDSDQALVRWFEQQILAPAQQTDDQQVRLESERNLVQIVTIHKSKGLEYDLVFLPFISHYRAMETAIFHQTAASGESQVVLDLQQRQENLDKAEKERLAEDLRLLYVAITRAVYGCYLGVAPIRLGRSSKAPTGNHRTAIGWLWQGAEPDSCEAWSMAVEKFAMVSGAKVCSLPEEVAPYQEQAVIDDDRQAAQVARTLPRNWWVTSYSGLVKQGHSYDASFEMPGFDREVDVAESLPLFIEQQTLSIADFPKGAGPGTFLHTLFELIDFTLPADHPDTMTIIEQLLQREGYEEKWQPVLQQLVSDVLSACLDGEALTLNTKSTSQKLVEMEFMFPIKQLSSSAVNTLLATHDPIAAKADGFGFETVSGMLKGFIDLVFEHQGKYYILDWKSNWLGETATDYRLPALQQAMMDHRYDLQYLLYCVALHRYLATRIADYDYETHFGGVYYLFLRGVTAQGDKGIFYDRPSQALIAELDLLMKGESE